MLIQEVSTPLLIFWFISNSFVISQTTILLEKENGVLKIPCSINGLPLKFVFDTGASFVCISLSEAKFMLKNGFISEEDIYGSTFQFFKLTTSLN